jgi:hypothetical protein
MAPKGNAPTQAVRLRRGASAGSGGWREVNESGESLPWWGRPTETPAVFALERSAKEMVHESCTADTRDHEDHTFCGMRCARHMTRRWRL